MNRPPLEVADLVRAAGRAFIERSRRWITWHHLTVLRAIARCRTAALGGHLDECIACGYRPAISYNSCRNRHCPKCQANARARWLQARRQELLPTRYVHVVFTLPHELAPLALQNKKLLYHLLLQTSAATLLEVARDPKHLGADIGFFSVLHTWNQKLEHHPHVHCVVPAGGVSLDRTHWIQPRYPFLLPVKVLSRVFRGKFVGALQRHFRQGKLGFHGKLKPLAHPKVFSAWIRTLFRNDWHVYSKRPFGGPEHVLRYLGAYTHRVAISNHRLVSLTDDQLTFRWRDSAHNHEHKLMTLALDEFLRRFLLHTLPKGFVRIRHFGFLANRRRATLLSLCFRLLDAEQPSQSEPQASPSKKLRPLWLCPQCGGPMVVGSRRKVVFEKGEEPAVAVVVVEMWEARFLRFPHFHNLVGRQNLVTLDLSSSPHKSAPGSHLGHGPGSTTQPKEFSNGDRSKPEPTTKGDAIGSESWYASSLPIRPGELQPTRTFRHVAV